MAPPPVPKDLAAYLSAPSTTLDLASDALEEWILYRRTKGDTLFEISLGLAELEEKTPHHITHAFDRARYLTSLPEPSDLSPPAGVFPLYRSQSPATILSHLLSQPEPSLEHSREVILEYVLARETKAREKRHGRGGRGTLGRDALEEISARLTEVEAGLMHAEGRRLELEELDQPRQLGMTLILSLRMSLSYFTSQEIAQQLLKVPIGVAERILVQHIRRRVAGEGRWGEGKELEYIESIAIPQRPALKPAFRSAKARTLLPGRPVFPVTLPAPGKSTCVKLIQTFATEGSIATSPSSYFSRKGFSGSNDSSSPKSPISPLPSITALPTDSSRLGEYAQEVLTEWATREKREYMLKVKWAKTGREQLSKELGEMEQALCLLSRQQPSPLAPTLVPVFLTLRRTFSLPPSPLPPKLVDAFIDQLPAPPDPDNEPFREPSIQSATGSLYVNPRLDDAAAFDILQELIVYETEILKEGDDRIDIPSALFSVVESVEKRFPDGSYIQVFDKAKRLAVSDGAVASTSITKRASTHRRAISSFVVPPEDEPSPPKPQHLQHARSTSLPHRRNTMDSTTDSDESIGVELTATRSSTTDRASMLPPIVTDRPPILPPLSFDTPVEPEPAPEPTPSSAGGWWDVVSAVQTQPPPAPWTDTFRSTNRTRTTSGGHSNLPLPPGAEPATIAQPQEPQLEQIRSIERNSTPSSSNPATPSRRGVSHESSPAPSPPHFDFSKRQSAATLNEELGNLMISPDRPAQNPYSPSPTRANGVQHDGRTTPRPPPRYHSDRGLASGSPSRASPSQLQRSHTDVPAVKAAYESDGSDSESDAEIRPTIRHVTQGGQHPMLQTMARPTPPNPSATPDTSHTLARGKTKTRGWKSVSAAMGITKDKDRQKEKEKDRDKENEKVVKSGNKAWPENEPGRWNKDLVASIMGPPADKR